MLRKWKRGLVSNDAALTVGNSATGENCVSFEVFRSGGMAGNWSDVTESRWTMNLSRKEMKTKQPRGNKE